MITLYWIWWLFVSGLAYATMQGCLVFLLPHLWDKDGGKQ